MIFSFSGGSTICSRFWAPGRPRLCWKRRGQLVDARVDGVLSRSAIGGRVDGVAASVSLAASFASTAGRPSRRDLLVGRRSRRDLLACDAAAHRAMLIVGRFFTGRRARQRTACLGTSGLELLSTANIASTDRPVALIASAAYCRVCYSTVLASIASHGALMHGCCNRLQLQASPSRAS